MNEALFLFQLPMEGDGGALPVVTVRKQGNVCAKSEGKNRVSQAFSHTSE